MKYFTIFTVLLFGQFLQAQSAESRIEIMKQTDVESLLKFSKKKNSNFLHYLNQNKLNKNDSIEVLSNNKIGYLSDFDLQGNPIYVNDYNLDCAITHGVNHLWVGGSSGLDLDGSDIEIGLWEGAGLPLLTHQELEGKIIHAENEGVSFHATYVAGTLVGTGIDNEARGMASQATIVARRAQNVQSEMAEFAANGGILSNHSYGATPPSNNAYYGYYTSGSAEWDEIQYLAPYLTICKAAGNHRDDNLNVGAGGYDLIYNIGIAKNLITIGAVDDLFLYSGPNSVKESDFSDWGPSDDWRIKPDIVANGVGIYSASSESEISYFSGDGTSSSCAAVTGAVALLQQHYFNLNESYMKSATIKALLLSTTEEAGPNDGPDFQYGWGLINAERAANVISNDGVTSKINELTLMGGDTFTSTIETDGESPLSLMIAWTDPPGNPNPIETDNRSPLLVNDLDVILFNADSSYSPWMIVPSNETYEVAAIRGDNTRDNVERIDVNNIPAGNYTLRVSHKGGLTNGQQDFSLVIHGIAGNPTDTNEEEMGLSELLISPNPSQDGKFKLTLVNESQQINYSVKVFDLLGNLIQTNELYQNESQIDLSHFHPGMYLISVSSGQDTYTQKIEITKL